jgi:hypothetical protein
VSGKKESVEVVSENLFLDEGRFENGRFSWYLFDNKSIFVLVFRMKGTLLVILGTVVTCGAYLE